MNEEFSWCFACGKDNPIGLKLDFFYEDDKYVSTFVPQKEHQSYTGRVHGGIIATVLDEVIGDFVYKKTGVIAVTARLELRYRKPVPIDKPVKVVATVLKTKGHMYEMKGELFLDDGTLAAEAKAKVLLDK